MENSAKFLYIAGGILIAIVIISIGAYMFYSGAIMTSQYDKKLSDEELQAYNAEFEKYVTGKDEDGNDIGVWLATDVVTVINKAYDINKNEDDKGGSDFITIEIYMPSSKNFAEYTLDKTIKEIGIMKDRNNKKCSLYDFIKNNTNTPRPADSNDYYSNKFSCSIEYYPNGKVEKMKFTCESKK